MIEDVATIGIAVETTGIEKGKKSLETLAQAGGRADDAMQKLGTGSKRAGADVATLAGETQKAGNAAKEAARGFESVASGFNLLKSAAAAYISLNTAQAIVKMADGVTQLNNQLRLATGSAVAAGQAYESLFQIAQKSRVSFTELGSTYAAIARAGNEMGVSQTRLLAVTQSISNAMTISGGSAQSMQAALVQLGQGLSSGTLRGEELNSIMEQTPRLAKAIADGLGVPIGALRKLGEQGELTAQQVITALEKVGPQLTREIESATLTVGQAFTVLGNSATKFVGTADEATGASATLASAIVSVSGALDSMGKVIQENKTAFAAITAGLAGAAAIAGLIAMKAALLGVAAAVGAIGIALAANPITLGIMAIAAGALALKSAADSAAKSETGLGYAIADLDKKISASEKLRESQTDAGIARLQRMRTERAKLQGELALLSVAGLDNRAEDNRLGAGVAAFKAREQVAKDFQALRQELSGVDKDFQKHLTQLKAGLDAGLITEANYVKEVEKLIAKEGGVRKAGAKATEDVYKSLREQGQAWANYIEDFQRDAAKADADLLGLTASQAKLAQMLSDPVFQQMPETWRQTALQAAYAAIAVEQQGIAQKKATDATKAAAKAHESYIADLNKSADSVGAHIQKLQDEEAALALSAAKHISLAQAIELVEIARLQEAVAVQLSYGDNTAAEAIQREIDARRELIGLIGNKEARDSSKKAAEDAAKEWQRTSEQINSTLTDALMRGFESGKDFARNMRDTIVNMFKTMVLRPVISAIVNPVAQGITGALGLAGAANAGTSGSALGALGGLGSFGSGLNAGFSALLGESGLSGALSAGFTSIGAGSVGAGAGTIVGALGPIALGIGALVAIAKATKGETRSGGQYTYNPATGTAFAQGPSGGQIAGAEVQAAITGTVTSINKLLQNAGSVATLTGFQAGLESSDKGRGGVFSGGTLSTGATFGESGKGSNYDGTLYEKTSATSLDSKAALENFTTDLMQGTIQALQAAGDIPKAIADQIKGVDAEALSADAAKNLLAAIDATVTGINNFRAAVDVLPFEALKNLSFDAAAGLIAAAGGLDKLGANLGTYYDNFYTEAEKTANTVDNISKVFAELGLPMLDLSASADDVRAAFRALVDGAMADTTAQGQKATAALLGVSGAVGGLASASESAALSAQKAADKIKFEFASLLDGLQAGRAAAINVASNALSGVADSVNAAKSDAQQVYENTIKALDSQEAALTAAYRLAVNAQEAIKLAAVSARNVASAGLDAERKAAATAYKTAVAAINDERKASVAAFDAAADAIKASIDAANKSIDLLRGLDGALSSAMGFFKNNDRSLASRESGQAQIAAALVDAQAGNFPTAESLADALAAVTQPSEQFFSTFEDFQRDYFKTAISISKLSNLTGTQLSNEEKSYQALVDTQSLLVSNHDAHMERLDAQKDALDLANESLQALFEQRAAAISATYDSAVSSSVDALNKLQSDYESALAGIADQRTAAKSTLDDVVGKLDAQLALAQKQYDDALGLSKPLQSIADALAALAVALANFKQIDAAVDSAQVAAGNPNVTTAQTQAYISTLPAGGSANALLYQYSAGNQMSAAQLALQTGLTPGQINDFTTANNLPGLDALLTTNGTAGTALQDQAATSAAALVASNKAITDAIAQIYAEGAASGATGDQIAMAMYNAAVGNGVSSAKLDDLAGWPSGTALKWALDHGLPAFAQGTNFVPSDMLALIHKGEAVIPAAFNPESYGRASGNDALVSEIKALREEVKQLRAEQKASGEAIAINTNKTAKSLTKWDVDGLPATTTAE